MGTGGGGTGGTKVHLASVKVWELRGHVTAREPIENPAETDMC